jgi:Mg-chelatase subunit ChlD
MTDRLDAAVGSLRAPWNSPVWDHDRGARKALDVLEDAHRDRRACDFIVWYVVADDPYVHGQEEVLRQMSDGFRGILSTDTELFVNCPYAETPTQRRCIYVQQTFPGRYYAEAGDARWFGREINRIVREPRNNPSAKDLHVTHVVPSQLYYVEGSASVPPIVSRHASGTTLRWSWRGVDANQPPTITYRVGGLGEEGRWPITAQAILTDTVTLTGTIAMRPITLTVSGLCFTPTPTATPVTPTGTPVPATATPTTTDRPTDAPTVTASATRAGPATPTPRPSATAPPGVAFLPIALRELCDPQHKRADVALVIDTSSSMAGRKLEDAKTAAMAFIGQMDLAAGRDQVAVIRYDTQAEVVCRLTNARAILDAGIRDLTSRIGTHIDAGLRLALAELESPRHLERNMSVVILLTDGNQTGTPGEELRAAAEVRAAGLRLYTIGLGADADAAALRQMAGDDSRYHSAPDSADLARIYAEIASDILCPAPAGGFWPGR